MHIQSEFGIDKYTEIDGSIIYRNNIMYFAAHVRDCTHDTQYTFKIFIIFTLRDWPTYINLKSPWTEH